MKKGTVLGIALLVAVSWRSPRATLLPVVAAGFVVVPVSSSSSSWQLSGRRRRRPLAAASDDAAPQSHRRRDRDSKHDPKHESKAAPGTFKLKSKATNQGNSKSFARHRSDAFLEITALLRSARSPQEIQQWMVDRHKRNISLQLYPHEQTQIIKELAARAAYDEILIFLRLFSDHSVYVYTSVIASLAQSKRHSRQALQLLQEMKDRGVVPNKYTFTALFNHIRGAKQARAFFQTLQHEHQYNIDSLEVFNAAIHACTRHQSTEEPDAWQTALQFYMTMRKLGLVPNRPTYSSLLLACAQAGQVKIAMSLLDDMPIPPNDVVWGAALTVCAKAGDYQQSSLILQKMQAVRAVPSTRHVSAHLAALAKSGQDALCLRILHGLKHQQPVELDDHDIQIQPVPLDLVIVNTVLYACAQGGNYVDARRLLTELKNGDYVTGRNEPIQPDEITYNTVISACTNEPQEVKALVKEMRLSRRHRHGQVPPTAKTYTLAISACKSDFETAVFLLHDSKHDGITPNVFMYSSAIWIAEKCGRVDEALALLDEMQAVGCKPNDVSYGGVIAAVAGAGRATKAIELFAEMKQKGIQTNGKIFGRLMEAIHRASLQDENVSTLSLLESILELMHADDFSVKIGGPILEALILEYGMNDRFDDALGIFDMICGPTNGPCLRAILSACALAPDRWENALAILHTSDIVEGARGPARMDMRAIGFAMLACSKSGQWEEALNLLELYGRQDVGSNHVPRSAINSLITACGRGGRPDMALKLLNDMKPKYGIEPNEISYRSAAIACNQAQHEMRRRQEQGLEPRVGSSSLQWWECSLSLLRRMKEDGLKPDAQTFSSIISACEAAGQWQRALGVLRDGPDDLNLYCFNAAVSACEKGGAWVEALELYYQMIDKGGVVRPNFVTLSSLLIALDSAGQKELAQDLYEQGIQSNIVRHPWTRTRSASSGELIRALDFHNYSSAMARTAIRSVMESLVNNGKPAHDVSRDLIVVVGKGKGSRLDPVLGLTVQEALQKHYAIECIVDPDNTGRLIVKSADLQAFAMANNAWR